MQSFGVVEQMIKMCGKCNVRPDPRFHMKLDGKASTRTSGLGRALQLRGAVQGSEGDAFATWKETKERDDQSQRVCSRGSVKVCDDVSQRPTFLPKFHSRGPEEKVPPCPFHNTLHANVHSRFLGNHRLYSALWMPRFVVAGERLSHRLCPPSGPRRSVILRRMTHS